MRLIKVPTNPDDSFLELVDFAPDRIPDYAILSHRWGNPADEISFSDLDSRFAVKTDAVRTKPGFLKLQRCCMQALADGLEYAWVSIARLDRRFGARPYTNAAHSAMLTNLQIDTCCIDKSSSADLSEAINSIFTWYGKAAICYAYLDDVPEAVDGNSPQSSLIKTLWATRGWTLQELIAPRHMRFFSADWVERGTKKSLSGTLSRLTGIDEEILNHKRSFEREDVGRRMSWASRRRTTRPEDIAYCLMGIFTVNMPLLYGEGDMAFIRLQEEILKVTEDHIIFAWTNADSRDHIPQGMLTKHPSYFQSYHDADIRNYWRTYEGEPAAMTSRGLRIALHMKKLYGDVYLAALDCKIPRDDDFRLVRWPLAVYLRRMMINNQVQYARIKCRHFSTIGWIGRTETRGLQTVYVRQHFGRYSRLVII